MRYEKLADLKAACEKARAGRAEELPYLVLDNDDTMAEQDGEPVFRMHPYEVLREALDLLGIPHEEA